MSTFTCTLAETWPLSGASAVIHCLHAAHTPVFNASACVYQSTSWIAEHYPRYDAACNACRQHTIIYASIEHAHAGGWWRH